MSYRLLIFVLMLSPLRLASAAQDTMPPAIVHEPCAYYTKGQAFEVLVKFIDESEVFDPKLIYRVAGGSWKNTSFVRVAGQDHFVAVLKEKELKGEVEYFIETFDMYGNGPARHGSPEAPVRLVAAVAPPACEQIGNMGPLVPDVADTTPPPPEVAEGFMEPPPPKPTSVCNSLDPPFYCSPWFWGATAGVVLLGGGTTAYFLLKDGGDSSSGGPLRVRVFAPSPTAVAGMGVSP